MCTSTTFVAFLAVVIGVSYYLISIEVRDYGEIDILMPGTAKTLEEYLSKHKEMISKHGEIEYEAYRRHLYRNLNYALYLLDGGNPTFRKNRAKYMELMEVAEVYHDIGLWSGDAVNHVYPSIAFMNKQNFTETSNNKYSEDDIELIYDMAKYHHKLTAFSSGDKLHDSIVNAFREANFVDLSEGYLKWGIPARIVRKVRETIPDTHPGFHDILTRVGKHNYIRTAIEVAKMTTW
eukprot:49731_1